MTKKGVRYKEIYKCMKQIYVNMTGVRRRKIGNPHREIAENPMTAAGKKLTGEEGYEWWHKTWWLAFASRLQVSRTHPASLLLVSAHQLKISGVVGLE